MDDQQFTAKYWYTNTQLVTVVNPRKEDFVFQATSDVGVDTSTGRMKSESRQYRVPSGGKERFPGTIANMYLDQMTKLVAQDEDKIQYLIDPSLRSQYYDQLTVSVEDLINTYTPFPEYLEKPAEAAPVEEKAFASVTPAEAPAAEAPKKPAAAKA